MNPTELATIRFTVPAVPVAQPRQRTRVMSVNGKSITQNYTPKNSPVNAFKATVRHAAKLAYGGAPLTTALFVDATFVFPRTKQLTWKTKPMPCAWHTKKPDCDNLLKALMDSLTGLVFVDDDQIAWVKVRKVIASGGEQPHVDVRIEELGELSVP